MTDQTFRIGTRDSDLALAQTQLFIEACEQTHPDLNLNVVTKESLGDQYVDHSLHDLPGKGFFTRDLDQLVLDGTLDAAVHSAKDVPTDTPDPLRIGTFLPREDSRDVFLGASCESLKKLPADAVIGTASPRRKAQIHRVRPDVTVTEIRGNVDTRVQKLQDSETPYDGLVLAAAGLKRLELSPEHSRFFPEEEFVPAPAQGAIVVQLRNDHPALKPVTSAVDHETTRFRVQLERSLLNQLGGGCRIPLGIHCENLENNQFRLHVFVGSDESETYIHERSRAFEQPEAETVREEMAKFLNENGASDMLERARQAME